MVAAMRTRVLAQWVFVLLASAACLSSAFAKKKVVPQAFPIKILEAKSVYLDCDCRKEMVVSVPSALPELLDWGRYGDLFDFNANTGQLTLGHSRDSHGH